MNKNIKITLSLALILFGFIYITKYGVFDVLAQESQNNQTQQEETTIPPEKSLQQEREELEKQLSGLEKEIEAHQKTINEYQKQGKTLNNEISSLNAKINKLNLQIKAINLNLTKINRDINETQKQINRTENKIDKNREVLSKTIRNIYEADNLSMVTILLANNKLSDFFGNLNNIVLVQESLRTTLGETVKLRQDLLTQKEELSLEKEDTENLKTIQQSQKKMTESVQNQKAQLLKTTKGKESEYQKLLQKTRASAAEIRTRLFQLLGGGELTFEKAYEYARLAENATGVRAALTLSILNRESLLGKNVGRCSYETAMHPTRDVPYFLDLLSRLGLDPKSTVAQVSCPNQHGSYGGAMGPAQFIPSTWKLYENSISQVTGSKPPSPWNNSDAFAATAIYMKDLLESASCRDYANSNQNTTSYQTLLERCAAAKYYSGSRWYTYRFWYGDPVVTQANEYEKDIQVIKNGNASTGKNTES